MIGKIRKAIDNKFIYYPIIMVIYIIVFVFWGDNAVLLWKDSSAYLAFDNRVGIMPIYPLLLHINKIIFGEGLFLYFIVAEQTVFTMGCVFCFTEYIRKRFTLSYFCTYPLIIISISMPFTVNYPLSISNHDIMTEALAYPFFYIYMVIFLKAIFDKRYKDFIFLILASTGLALLRTQLQLIIVFNAAAFFYVAWMHGRKYSLKKQMLRVIGIIVGCIIIIGIGEVGILGANFLGQKAVVALNSMPNIVSETDTENNVAEKSNVVSQETGVGNVTKQYGHLIIDKAIYEINEEDYLLFDDNEMKKLCIAIFEEADARKSRYVYAQEGLWKWKDIMEGIASGTSIAISGWTQYYDDNPNTYLTYESVNDIAFVLLKEHFGRVFYHTLCMMPQGFICTVFFQKEQIYMLCHIIMIFIYLSAFALVIWAYRVREIPNIYAEFLLGCIVINILFVIILSTLFFSMQRYLIYCFGIFYVAYYLMLLRVYTHYADRKSRMGKVL